MEFEFAKMNGLGNSFVLMNDLEDTISEKTDIRQLARKVCDVHFGIGADGLILVKKSQRDDLRMVIINEDGSEAEMCGNGVRCFARYALDKKLTDKEELRVETLAGTIVTRIMNDGRVEVDMGKPVFRNADISSTAEGPVICEDIDGREFTYVSMGNPHAIAFVENFDFDWKSEGSRVEQAPVFPHHTNVEYVKVETPKEVTMKVWERGCGETMACGTGACALVVAGVMHKKLHEGPVTVHLPGGDLLIHYRKGESVRMTGPAVEVCFGTCIYDVQ